MPGYEFADCFRIPFLLILTKCPGDDFDRPAAWSEIFLSGHAQSDKNVILSKPLARSGQSKKNN